MQRDIGIVSSGMAISTVGFGLVAKNLATSNLIVLCQCPLRPPHPGGHAMSKERSIHMFNVVLSWEHRENGSQTDCSDRDVESGDDDLGGFGTPWVLHFEINSHTWQHNTTTEG